jgi:hypothetical protein
MTYESIPNLLGAYKVVLEERAEGVYVNVLEHAFSRERYIGMHQSDLTMANRACNQDYGIKDYQWMVVPDVNWHALG